MTPEEKLMAARCKLITIEPFYGHFGMQINWKESAMDWLPPHQWKTMAVSVRNGHIDCIWHREFVISRTVPQLFSCIQHEIEHLVRLHCIRFRPKYNQLIWNIASDMCVNGKKSSPRIGCIQHDKKILPVDEKKENVTLSWIPENWPGDETSEYYYNKMMEDPSFENLKCMGDLEGMGAYFFDDHSQWGKTDMSPDDIRQVISEVVKQVTQRAQGRIPGHLSEILSQLSEPIIGWRQMLRQYFGRHLGNKRRTYSRRDRRHDHFGTPGVSHHAAAKASVIIDTSGSISTDELQQFFAEIEAIAYRSRVCVLQWDSDFQGFWSRYRRNDWKKIKIKGRGGTDMAAPVLWLEKNHLVGDVCIMLTDGVCNYTEQRPFPMVTCITTPNGSKPDWGKVVRMVPESKKEVES